ncbi:formate dehydrogenase family accessory protein FdhD [Bordetella holmesii ATCC 51541]|nr:formate dehydrogenase family accessory protein FdhD [Bordetella holmesii ATCC 51541]
MALEFNGISHATMLATPTDLEDFALGFALSEGIVDVASDVRGIDLDARCDGIVVQLEIATACEVRLKQRRRAMAGRTGCGLCGVETLPEVLRQVTPLPAMPALPLAGLLAAMRALRARQVLHEATGATHAAGWADATGVLHVVREDVGRHNALDKLVGALARAGLPGAQGMVVVSSRASFEMVQKTASAGIGVLAAVSAPTALAQRLAEQTGLTLVGFVRGENATLYSHPGRLV